MKSYSAPPEAQPADAIAQRIARSLPNPNLRVRVQERAPWLQILFEAHTVPDARHLVSLSRRVTADVAMPEVRAVVVYGRILGETTPAWTHKFARSDFAAAPTAPASSQAASVPTRPASDPPEQSVPERSAAKPPRRIARVMALTLLGFSLGGAWGLVDRDRLRQPLNAAVSQFATNWVPETVSPAPTDLTAVLPPPVAIPTPVYPSSITLKAVGDIVPGTDFPNNRLPADPSIFFGSVAAELESADLTFGNFESVLTDYPNSAKDISRGAVFAFRAPPSYAELFETAGFDVLNIANNHSMDFGEPGLTDTVSHFAEVGIETVGQKNQILYTEANGIPVAFIGFSTYDFHNSINDEAGAKRLIAEAQQNAEIVVISIHAGAEGAGAANVSDRQEFFFGEDRGNIVRFSRTAIDAGADLILGHGPHIPRAIELYRGKLIAYSLGNFVGYRTLSTEGRLAYSLILEVELNLEGDFLSGAIVPVHLGNDGIPRLDRSLRSVNFIRSLTQTDFPSTPVTIDADGAIAVRESP